MDEATALEFRDKLLSWHRDHRQLHPWRSAIGDRANPYRVWVAEIMLQQTTIATVTPRYQSFIKRYPDLADLATTSPAELRCEVRGLGYYSRFQRMHLCAQWLHSRGVGFPEDYDELLKLPGIGPYTAAAIASLCFNQPVPVIDGNVKRVMSRVLDLRLSVNHSQLGRPLMADLSQIIDPQYPGLFNEALMGLGQKMCTPRTPKCSRCPVEKLCLAKAHNTVAHNPAPLPPKVLEPLKVTALIYQFKDRLAMYHRDAQSLILKSTWGWPLIIKRENPHSSPDSSLGGWEQHWHYDSGDVSLGQFSHRITRFAITVEVILVNSEKAQAVHAQKELRSPELGYTNSSDNVNIPITPQLRWVTHDQAPKEWISSLDQKAWKLYQTNRKLINFSHPKNRCPQEPQLTDVNIVSKGQKSYSVSR